MVNKQYTVQPARKLPNTNSSTPPPFSGMSVIASVPNPINNLDAASEMQRQSRQSGPHGTAAMAATAGGAVYARNIAYVHNHHPHATGGVRSMEVTNMFADGGNSDRVNNLDKDVAIKDIGRFQYILQMDREMATHPNSPAYRLHPHTNNNTNASQLSVSASSNNSASDSINSTNNHHNPHSHHFSFWKADNAHMPIAYGSSSSSGVGSGSAAHIRRHHRWLKRTGHCLNSVWIYAKWPLAALLACSVVATLVYFALVANTDYEAGSGTTTTRDMTHEDFVRFDSVQRTPVQSYDGTHNDLNPGRSADTANRTAQLMQLIDAVDSQTGDDNNDDDGHQTLDEESISGRLAIFVQSSADDADEDDGDGGSFNDDLLLGYGEVSAYEDAIQYTSPVRKPDAVTHTSSDRPQTVTQPAVTVTKRFRNTQIIEISTPKHLPHTTEAHRNVDVVSIVPNALPVDKGSAQQRPRVASTLMFPTKETFEIFGFTSGHQNNFGVPIEEDERMLRMLNEQLLQADSYRNSSNGGGISTTDSTVLRARVSPTLPNLRNLASTTERQAVDPIDEGICQSTTLSLCRTVLPYDLTSVEHSRNMSVMDVDHFKYLVESQCSARAHEFICSVLQPECRPERMGTLQPCKRSCKAILEPCGHVIAASEFLTAAFDCDSFPDSHDPDECRDATRDAACLANEFQCDDRTCVPSQWRCDNIKDCAEAEDELECTFCEHDEFRCPNTDKCIPDKWRCDEYDDCPDAADEFDCEFGDESRPVPTTQGHGRTFPYTQELSASRAATGTSTGRPYQPISGTGRGPAEDDANNGLSSSSSSSSGTTGRDELLAEASGVALPLSKSLANFQDSKEIMMTSDSETDFKFATRSTVTDGEHPQADSTLTTLSTLAATADHVSPCPVGELRCVSGKCITVSQLCDKIADCPDGADEAMCVYKTLEVQ